MKCKWHFAGVLDKYRPKFWTLFIQHHFKNRGSGLWNNFENSDGKKAGSSARNCRNLKVNFCIRTCQYLISSDFSFHFTGVQPGTLIPIKFYMCLRPRFMRPIVLHNHCTLWWCLASRFGRWPPKAANSTCPYNTTVHLRCHCGAQDACNGIAQSHVFYIEYYHGCIKTTSFENKPFRCLDRNFGACNAFFMRLPPMPNTFTAYKKYSGSPASFPILAPCRVQ